MIYEFSRGHSAIVAAQNTNHIKRMKYYICSIPFNPSASSSGLNMCAKWENKFEYTAGCGYLSYSPVAEGSCFGTKW